MRRLDAVNALALGLSLAASFGLALGGDALTPRATTLSTGDATGTPLTHLEDATGRRVAIKPWSRIVSGSTVSDGLLLRLCAPERVVAYTSFSAQSLDGHRYGDKAILSRLDDVESVLRLKPDLVIVNNFASPAKVARLREAGLEVFDLGPMTGVNSVLDDIDQIALLIGHPERGTRLRQRWTAQLEAITNGAPKAPARRGLYLSVYGDRLYGGTVGSNFHDILRYAGLVDAAAAHYSGWPNYTSEQLLQLDPDLIVTHEGMEVALCRHVGLDALRVCQGQGQIIELNSMLLNDPGLSIQDAAAALHDALAH